MRGSFMVQPDRGEGQEELGNPALEEFFGRPETIERLSDALRQASAGLNELKGTLDGEVSGLVPAGWEGQAASAFGQHWQRQSAMTAQAAQSAGWMSTAIRVLASEMRAARGLFQQAETSASVNGCYITPVCAVLPYGWWDLEAVAAMEWIQAEVAASMAMAEAARSRAPRRSRRARRRARRGTQPAPARSRSSGRTTSARSAAGR